MGLLDTNKLPAAVYKAMNRAVFYAVTLHQRGDGYDDNGVPNAAEASITLRGCVTEYSVFRRQTASIPDGDVEVILAQHKATATPKTGDGLTARGVRYEVVNVAEDPAKATWQVQARRA